MLRGRVEPDSKDFARMTYILFKHTEPPQQHEIRYLLAP